MALEVTVHLERELGLANVKNVAPGTTVLQLKEELAADDPTGCLKPEDFVLGCDGKRLADGERITSALVDLDLWQAEDAPPEPDPAPAAATPTTALALAPAPQAAAPTTALALAPEPAAVPAQAPAPQAAAAPTTALSLAPQPAAAPAKQATKPAAGGNTGDWVRYKTADGKAYFYDNSSGTTQWEEPAVWRDAEQVKAAAPTDKAKWVRYQDAEGKYYFHDAVNGVTQWEEPFEWTDPVQVPKKAATPVQGAAGSDKPKVDGVKPCSHPLCNFRVHSSNAVSVTHCCRICKNTPTDKEPEHGGRCERWPVDGEKPEAKPAAAAAAAPATAPAVRVPSGVADENSLRKLFESMDRGGNGQVSKRDILVALKKHPPVRRLFGLPVTNVEPGGEALEARLLAIQESFEAGSGLGELSDAYEALRAATDDTGQTFGIAAFMSSCRTGPLRGGACLAAGLLPREHATGAAFIPTHFWAEVPGDAVCPGGLEYKMDMSTGKTLARLPPGAASGA